MDALKNVVMGETVDIKVVNLLKYMFRSIGFTDTIFVSTTGNDQDGSTWEKAYTSLKTAMDWIEANQSSGECHLIILGDNSWDMDTTGAPTYTANIAIYGIDSRNQAYISNNHATATHVLKFTGWCSINNLCIDCGTGNIGIEIEGIGANGSRLRKICFDCTALTAGADAILLDGGVSDVKIWDCSGDGEAVNTSGIRLNNANHCTIQEIKIHTALVGLQSDHANDDNNEFIDCHLHGCVTGIQIANAGATGNHFHSIYFNLCTTRISDGGTSTKFSEIHPSSEIIHILPETASVGTVVASLNIANSYAANYSQIDDGSTFTKPFKIVGAFFGNPSDNTATYIIKLATGAAASEVDIARFIHQSDKFTTGLSIPIKSGTIPAGTRISANCQTENAVANTIQIWLLYVPI